jgi:long-subunit acyl-CoA synthetase (AMP-forming)
MQSAYNGWAKLPLKEEDVLLNVLPLEHVFGFVCGLLWGLSSGCAVALGRGPRHYFDDLKYFHPTAVSVVPLLLGYLLKGAAINAECRLILVGAGDCPDELMAAVKAAGIRLAFGYGLTETSSGVAISVSGDARAMEICPDDTIVIAQDGEILISAPTCMMAGYYKREEDTRAVLRDGILYTGDLGYLDEDGRLHITGRKKEILVLPDGTKIFLPEYEALLSEYMGGMEYAVVVRNDRPVLVYHGKLSPEEVMEKITPFNITRPRSHQIVAAVPYGKALPRTQTGKVKRWQIQKEI